LDIAAEGIVKDGFEQTAAVGLARRELQFQPVADCRGFIHFGDDAVFYAKKRTGRYPPTQV
jgi:hypothetical protein